jgi:N utilization substance protein B
VRGVVERAAELNASLQPFLDRPARALSPVEHALLLIGAFELSVSPDVPYRVVINEAVELAKAYGGTDGHKYVNGVLDKLAAQLRPQEARKG